MSDQGVKMLRGLHRDFPSGRTLGLIGGGGTYV